MINKTPEPFINSFNDCIIRGKCFHPFFRNAYLKLIPKKTSHELISSWRPISISSNIYKIYSKLLYLRLDGIVDKLLLPPQKGFRKSKNINDVTNNIRTKLDSLTEQNLSGFLMSVDFRSAFDSISFDYIPKMLKLFGFSNEFIKIISNYLIGGKATINLENGNFTQFFDIEQGIGQGLPLSVLIFILSIEPLIIKIVHTNNFKNFRYYHNIYIDKFSR